MYEDFCAMISAEKPESLKPEFFNTPLTEPNAALLIAKANNGAGVRCCTAAEE